MRGRLAWIAGGIGLAGAFAVRALRGRSAVSQAPAPPTEPTDTRAEELRQRLEESRALVEEREEFERGETPVDLAEPPPSPEQRRRTVHDRGRAAAERMRDPSEPE